MPSVRAYQYHSYEARQEEQQRAGVMKDNVLICFVLFFHQSSESKRGCIFSVKKEGYCKESALEDQKKQDQEKYNAVLCDEARQGMQQCGQY